MSGGENVCLVVLGSESIKVMYHRNAVVAEQQRHLLSYLLSSSISVVYFMSTLVDNQRKRFMGPLVSSCKHAIIDIVWLLVVFLGQCYTLDHLFIPYIGSLGNSWLIPLGNKVAPGLTVVTPLV